ncbi:MAG TPA: ATP-binding cassette domain-containing protein [Flavobacteriaceae bacterium]|jgi:cell division transport system ATP-binding protein|nr:ATP-binding cassette domain-containing protein [Flavobacteriaceae bacterium]HJO70979.1 ATP-binding cassette domain-containing protein [Flavobacteriaceae bacterium]|tara:strand:+ start:113 stop:787 length:675 start_codon:yes stop_codon:yes gene_type:complete
MSLVFIESLDIQLSGKEILTDINLNIEKGGMTFLIGKTGSGKTTLIKSFYGDISINSSERFEIAGFNLKKIKDYQIPFLRRKIGIVFQDFKLLDDRSIYKNLEFVLKATGWLDNKKIEDRILEVLNMVGVEINLDTYPSKLSGGEQQRIAIARALLNNPELIIADEPTGNLDPETSVEIISLFEKLNNLGITMIIATHDYNLILKLPGKIYKCENRKLFEVVRK